MRENAITLTGGKFVKQEFSYVFSYLGGPWNSKAHRNLFKELGLEILANFDYTFVLYKALYPRMVALRRSRGDIGLGVGTLAHMEEFWYTFVVSSKIITGTDTSYENNRWRGRSKSWDVYEDDLDSRCQTANLEASFERNT